MTDPLTDPLTGTLTGTLNAPAGSLRQFFIRNPPVTSLLCAPPAYLVLYLLPNRAGQ